MRAPDQSDRRGEGFTRSASALADDHTHALFRTESQSFLGERALGSVRLALSARLGALPPMTPVEIWSQDEARIGQKNGLVRGSDTGTAIHELSMRCYVETLGPR